MAAGRTGGRRFIDRTHQQDPGTGAVEGDRASATVDWSGVNWRPLGFGDTQLTRNLQQQLTA